MKIALVGPTYPYRGGISHYTTLLYRALKKEHQIKFFSFLYQYPKWLFPGKSDIDKSKIEIKEEGVERTLNSLNPFTWIKTAFLVKRFDPHLLILPWWSPFWTPHFLTICGILKLLSKTKIVFICHNVAMHEARFFDKACMRAVLGYGNYFIVHSQKEKQDLVALLPAADVRTTFHPTYEIFKWRNLKKGEAKKELGVSGRALLFFGFVREYKGLRYLLEAMPMVLEEIRDLTLLIAGEFWQDKAVYLDLIDRLGIKGKVKIFDKYIPNEEVERYFQAADLVALPYLTVTGSGVVQVALGLEKPVITTNIGSLKKIVLHGKTGYLVEPADADALANSILKFFREHKEEEFTENIRRRKDLFSWEKLVKIIEGFYNE